MWADVLTLVSLLGTFAFWATIAIGVVKWALTPR